jgi:hypothetical protein
MASTSALPRFLAKLMKISEKIVAREIGKNWLAGAEPRFKLCGLSGHA